MSLLVIINPKGKLPVEKNTAKNICTEENVTISMFQYKINFTIFIPIIADKDIERFGAISDRSMSSTPFGINWKWSIL